MKTCGRCGRKYPRMEGRIARVVGPSIDLCHPADGSSPDCYHLVTVYNDWGRCCCVGVVGNTHYKCLGSAMDLGHCRGDECSRRCITERPADWPAIPAPVPGLPTKEGETP